MLDASLIGLFDFQSYIYYYIDLKSIGQHHTHEDLLQSGISIFLKLCLAHLPLENIFFIKKLPYTFLLFFSPLLSKNHAPDSARISLKNNPTNMSHIGCTKFVDLIHEAQS